MLLLLCKQYSRIVELSFPFVNEARRDNCCAKVFWARQRLAFECKSRREHDYKTRKQEKPCRPIDDSWNFHKPSAMCNGVVTHLNHDLGMIIRVRVQ